MFKLARPIESQPADWHGPTTVGSADPAPDSGQRGASLVEYALLIALIAVVCIGAVSFFGGELNSSISAAGSSIN